MEAFEDIKKDKGILKGIEGEFWKNYTIKGLRIHPYLMKNLDGTKTVRTTEEF